MSPLASLSNRIFLASTLLVMVSIGSALYVVSSGLRTEAEAALQRDLRETVDLVEQQRALLHDGFTRTARLIADLPKFKAAIATGDRPTIEPIARDYQEQAGADLFRVTDAEGRLLAQIGGSRSGVLEVISVPVELGLDRPERLGTLTLGYLLDDQRAERFKAVTGADIAFAAGGQVRSSTLGPGARPILAGLLRAGAAPRAVIGSHEYTTLVTPLAGTDGNARAPADPSAPVAIVLHSRAERMRTLFAIERVLAATAAVTVLLAAVLSFGVARTVTRPLARITDHMRQVAATGDLTRTLDVAAARGWQDEDARVLATTFNTLTESVTRFQREAAQRERLSSLGRLSTVIAHEIRNPLMIIKGALRQLGRPGVTDADVRDAACDIDGEITRLNRVVNEVLDFARPIRFDRTTTDINALCRDAVAAVVAAEPDPRVATNLDSAAPMLETDAERVRTVLVNLLTNARQAVAALPGDTADAAVTLTTARLSDSRVAISVTDRGAGIAADDLPRIFDPYFTTRRTGTGLGLPIAKNIVEGLGGTITVTSTVGTGTSIRIELGQPSGAAAV